MISPNAYVRAETLAESIKSLESFMTEVNTFDEELQKRLLRLHESFRDQAYEAFVGRIRESRNKIAVFREETMRILPELKRDLEALRHVASLDSQAK